MKHTCGCPTCTLHNEMCIRSLTAQITDLQSRNQELQRSHQELSQDVAAVAGIPQSYGDRMTQILSTQAKQQALVPDYLQESREMVASVADHLRMYNHNTAKCYSAVEALAKNYATMASRLDEWDQWYTTPTQPVLVVPPPQSAVPTSPQFDLVTAMEPYPPGPT